MVVDFHTTNYFGENMVIVGTGKIEHQMLVDLAEQYFSSVARKATRPIKGLEKAVFNPGLLMIRDDEMIQSSIGVFYEAPDWHHKDFYSFLLLQRVFGNFTIDKNHDHLNDVKKQYNSM
jgi:processing peptidase subunit beta